MEEAEALTTRIGIFAQGQMRCLGSPIDLKNRFGNGFRLVFRLQLLHQTHFSDNLSEVLKTREEAALAALDRIMVERLCPVATPDLALQSRMRSNVTMRAVDGNGGDVEGQVASWFVNRNYRLPPSVVGDLGRLFVEIDRCVSVSQKLGADKVLELGSFRIVEWAINQATLEDVFVRVAQDYL
jgi:hypothetical protein